MDSSSGSNAPALQPSTQPLANFENRRVGPYLLRTEVGRGSMAAPGWRRAMRVSTKAGWQSNCSRPHGWGRKPSAVSAKKAPANVLVDTAGKIKLLDFGISKLLEQQDAMLTRTRLP
jgi:hypothetical protein